MFNIIIVVVVVVLDYPIALAGTSSSWSFPCRPTCHTARWSAKCDSRALGLLHVGGRTGYRMSWSPGSWVMSDPSISQSLNDWNATRIRSRDVLFWIDDTMVFILFRWNIYISSSSLYIYTYIFTGTVLYLQYDSHTFVGNLLVDAVLLFVLRLHRIADGGTGRGLSRMDRPSRQSLRFGPGSATANDDLVGKRW